MFENLNTQYLIDHLRSQYEFSLETFGPGTRHLGVLDHIAKELVEVRQAPDDLEEWADLLLLSCDGAMRQGFLPKNVAEFASYPAASLHGDLDEALDHIETMRCWLIENPTYLQGWHLLISCIFYGAQTRGFNALELFHAAVKKLAKNKKRTWPDWRTMPTDKAITHVK